MKTVICVLAGVIMVLGIGCAALSSYVTPATLDQGAIDYASQAGVISSDELGGYPNLIKAERLQTAVDGAHQNIQLDIQQIMEKDNLKYSQLKSVVASNLATAKSFEDMMFGETGLLSTGLAALGAGGLAGFVGLMRKRPGDVTSEELSAAITKATSGIESEKISTETALTQVVASVQKFLDTADPTIAEKFKLICSTVQDTSTQVAVAEIKASTV